MSQQSRKFSFIESIVNSVFGVIISLLIQYFVLHTMFNISITLLQNIQLTFIFTSISIIRTYIIRRIFNNFKG